MRLPVRPLPYSGESTVGYLHRLAIRNGYADAHQLAALAANDACYRQEGAWHELIQSWTGHTPQQLDLLPLRKCGRGAASHYLFKGVHLHRKHVVKGHNICPQCWRENRLHHASWQLVWKPVCDIHFCPLVVIESAGDGRALAQSIKDTRTLCTPTGVQFLVTHIQQVVDIQDRLTRDILCVDDAGFRYHQACNYVDRLIDRLHPKSGMARAGAPIQRSQETPASVISCMLAGGL